MLSGLAYAQSDFARARSLAKAALGVAEEVASSQHLSRAFGNLGMAALAQNDRDEASALLERAVAHADESGYPDLIARWRLELGRVVCAQGDYARAHTLLAKSLKVFQAVGDQFGIARCFEAFGDLALSTGHAEHALLLGARAAALRDVLKAPMWAIEHERLQPVLDEARTMLGERAAAVWQAGQSMPLDQALDLAGAMQLRDRGEGPVKQ